MRLATVAEHRAGASQALAATPKGAKALVDALKGSASSAGDTLGELERLIDAANRARNLLAARVTALEQDTGVADASTSAKGIVELATVAEHRTGASERLAATPKGAKALVDALKGSASSAGDTLGELEALITALAARITALEDRPMGQETLIFISDAGVNVAVGAPGVDFDLTADLDDYDAIYFLGTSPAGNANNAVQTEMVPTSEITANSNVAAQGINGTAAVIKLNKEAARRINLRGTNGQFEAVNMIVGVKFARP